MPEVSVPDAHAPAGPPAKPSLTIQNAVSLIVVAAFVTLIFVWLFFPPAGDAAGLQILNMLTGILATAFSTVVGFHLGSSKSSEDKTDTIKQLAVGTGTGTGNGNKTP